MPGPTKITWGDGTPEQDGPEEGTATHTFTDGDYDIVVADADNPKLSTTVHVTIPMDDGTPQEPPTATAAADPADPSGRTAKVAYSGFPVGTVKVAWGDGSPEETGKPNSGELAHPYAAEIEGAQTITLTSEADPTKTATATFTPTPATATPTVTAAADPADTTGRTVKATLAGFPADGAVSVDFGDGTPAVSVPAGTTEASHPYAAEVTGEQTITATSATDATKTATATFTPTASTAPAVAAEAEAADATGHTANVTLTGFPASSATTVDWGDGTAAATLPAGTTSGSHVYDAALTGDQTITATAANDQAVTATATFTLPASTPQPSITAAPDTSDPSGRTFTLTLAGFPAASATSVDWGDGAEAESVPAGTTTATHAYPDTVSGEVTITATAADDATVTASTSVTVPETQPAEPTITAAADPADTTGRTAAVTLAGFAADAAVTVDWGDGTAATTVPAGTTTATHAYAEAVTGEQTITATSAADQAQTATTAFTPGGGSALAQARTVRKRR